MALTDFVVVRVMRGGDFHHARALFHVGMFVADNRNFALTPLTRAMPTCTAAM